MYLINKEGHSLINHNNNVYYSSRHQFYRCDSSGSWSISRDEYVHAKFGTHKIDPKYIWHRTAKFSNNDFLTVSYRDENKIRYHNAKGEVVKELPNLSKDTVELVDIAIDKDDHIWTVEYTYNRISKYNLIGEMLFEKRNDYEEDPFTIYCPEAITAIGDHIFISDSGNRRIAKLSIHEYNLETDLKVPEHVYYFESVENYEVYQLYLSIYFREIVFPIFNLNLDKRLR